MEISLVRAQNFSVCARIFILFQWDGLNDQIGFENGSDLAILIFVARSRGPRLDRDIWFGAPIFLAVFFARVFCFLDR